MNVNSVQRANLVHLDYHVSYVMLDIGVILAQIRQRNMHAHHIAHQQLGAVQQVIVTAKLDMARLIVRHVIQVPLVMAPAIDHVISVQLVHFLQQQQQQYARMR